MMRGMAIAEAWRKSMSNCASRSVVAMSWIGLLGRDYHPRDLLAELAARR